MLRVVDLNHWKGDANLNAIPYDAAIMKATGGNGYVDNTCDTFVQQAIAARVLQIF
jgi:lysozyme